MKKGIFVALAVLVTSGLFACSKSTGGKKDETERNDLYSRFVELSENVSKLPSTMEVYGLEYESIVKPMSAEIKYDLTNETDEYKSISAYRAYYSSTWESFDKLKNEGIDIRDFALENIKEFDRWINDGGSSYYVSYDQVLDQVSIIRYNEQTTVDIKSSYDFDGNAVISVVYYWNEDIGGSGKLYNDSIKYTENVKWVGTRSYCSPDSDYSSIIEADLRKNLITQIDYQYAKYDEETDIEYVEPIVNVEMDGIYYILGRNGEHEYINAFDEDGHRIYKRRKFDSAMELDIPLYALSGWDKAYTIEDDTYAGKLIVEAESEVYVDRVFIDDDKIQSYFLADATGSGLEPMLIADCIDASYTDISALDLVLKRFNFSYISDDIVKVLEVADDISTILSERSAFNTDSLELVTIKQYMEIYNRINPGTFTMSTIESFAEEIKNNSVDIDKQNPSAGIYNYVDGSAAGNIIFNDGRVCLSDVNVSLTHNALLSNNIDYTAKLLLVGKDGAQELLSSNSVRFDGKNDLSFNFGADEISILQYLTSGTEYTLELAIFASESRISRSIPLHLAQEKYSGIISVENEISDTPTTVDTYEITTSYTIYSEDGSIKIALEISSALIDSQAKE